MTDSYRKILPIVAVAILLLCACTQSRQPCLIPKTASLKLRAVQKTLAGTNLDTALSAAVLGAVTPAGVKGFLFTGKSIFTLSLSPAADTSMWLFAPDTAVGSPIDTIIFRYERQLQFVSNACGYTHYFNIVSVSATAHTIDSVQITDRSVTTNANTNHLLLYIHPHP